MEDYEEMMKQYPILFKQRFTDKTETCMCWGIEAGLGWYNSLNKCCSYLEELNNIYYPKYKISIQANQVKSKWAELRFYFSIIDDEYYNSKDASEDHKKIIDMLYNISNALIKQCEDKCWDVCEWCGADGEHGQNLVTTKGGWISRICKKCAKDSYDKEIKHFDEEVNKTEYKPRITWFHNGYEFLNPYHINGFNYNNEYYNSIIEAFFCEKDSEHKKLYKNVNSLNAEKAPAFIEKLADSYNIHIDDTKEDYDLFKNIIRAKFTYEYNKNIKKELLETSGKILQNMGKHHNNIWGYCTCDKCKDKEHKDLYAKILMEIRDELK